MWRHTKPTIAGFLNTSTIDTLNQTTLHCAGLSYALQDVYLLVSLASTNYLDANSTLTPHTGYHSQKCLQTLPNVPCGAKITPADDQCISVAQS